MYDRCLVCGRGFAPNDVLESLGRGRRVAYDLGESRLWVICTSCRRWSLCPLESRWEALEELEKLVSDVGRPLARTDNVALFRVGSLEVVRVGQAGLREEAWWRFGKELQGRRERYRKLSAAGTIGATAAIAGSWATGGMSFLVAWLLWDQAPTAVTRGARWFRFGTTAWQGVGKCRRCGRAIGGVRFAQRGQLVLGIGEASPVVLVGCPACRKRPDSGLLLQGQEGNRVLRRVLAYHHFSGASERRVQGATRLIQVLGGPERLSSRLLKDGRTLSGVGATGAIALEISIHKERERRLLQMELAELEAHWRREEELARIIDEELSFASFGGAIRRKIPPSISSSDLASEASGPLAHPQREQ